MTITMKRFFLSVLLAAVVMTAASADEAAIRSVRIGCVLDREGTAHIHEWWDVTTVKGTEWYLVRENLGDIEIENFSVTDEDTGREYVNEGSWDVDRTLEEKDGRCGIHETSDGCELCWGFGSYGDHKFHVRYKMRNAAKSLDDYDMLHIQFVSDRLSSPPQNVKLVLEIPGQKIDSTNARIWGFGYKGKCIFTKDRVYMESDGPFDYNSSLILLMRLDKGMISPASVQKRSFKDHLDYALEGSEFTNDPPGRFERLLSGIFSFLLTAGTVLWYGGWIPLVYLISLIEWVCTKRRWLGTLFKRTIPWCRDVPYGGDILAANYAMLKVSPARIAKKARVASAMILRMISLGAISVRTGRDGKVELYLGDVNRIDKSDSVMRELWDMIREAAGKDHALQDTEFSRWAKSNGKKVSSWVQSVKEQGRKSMERGGCLNNGVITDAGIRENRRLFGLRNFLDDFTLVEEKRSVEAVLWQDYLVYGALFGIADKVARELRDINPEAVVDPDVVVRTVYVTNDLGTSIMRAKSAYDSSVSSSGGSGSGHSSFSGGGGHSSYSGGRGYSGGGHGGGCR